MSVYTGRHFGPVATILLLALTGSAACAGRLSTAAPDGDRGDAAESEEIRGDRADEKLAAVEGDDLPRRSGAKVEEMLAGRFPGIRVMQMPGGGISLRLYGPSTIFGNNEPLYVVDGMQVNNVDGQGLYWLNPADIQKVEVVKDASALSMYGVRGANGVVLITTRRGPQH